MTTTRQKGRAVPDATSLTSTLRPAEWGPWEWRNHVTAYAPAWGLSGMQRACLNRVYSVQFYQHDTEWGIVDHSIIRRHDIEPVRSWWDIQRIKNELMGLDRVGIEVYPQDAALVDAANVYHLWVLPEGFELPFGLHINTLNGV